MSDIRYCPIPEHTQWVWPISADGEPICPFDHPMRLDETERYWSWGEGGEGPLTAFDDAARIAYVYPALDPEAPAIERAYTQAENDRADQMTVIHDQSAAQIAYERAVGLNAAPAELAALQEANRASAGVEPGDPWVQPTGAHDAYPLDALVSHNGKTWRSTIAANVWEPGVSGWVEEGEGIPDWVQPTGGHDAYPLGAVVRHVGKVWQSLVAANVWEPGAVGSETLWMEIPEP